MELATTVIIPARNEATTVGDIVKVFNTWRETSGHVYVGVDRATTDLTGEAVRKAGGYPIRLTVHGKGQVVWQSLRVVDALFDLSDWLILCDADYTGLTLDHIRKLTDSHEGMTIGIPDWPEAKIPDHVIQSWPMVSGFRYLPVNLIPPNAHGYLLETQINLRAIERGWPIRKVFMDGLKSPFHWPMTERRAAAREADRAWGKAHGIL